MKMFLRFLFLGLGIYFCVISCNNQPKATVGEKAVYQLFENTTDSILFGLDAILLLTEKKADLKEIQQKFAQSRFHYKTIEGLVEYYFQGLSKRLNGPALPDVKVEDGQTLPPQGFQVVEQILFDGFSDESKSTLVASIKILQNDVRFVKANLPFNAILPQHIYEIIQHQFIRITTLGITGFDAPLSKLSLPEAKCALLGIHQVAAAYGLSVGKEHQQLLNKTLNYLDNNKDFDLFNRLEFITQFLMPLSQHYTAVPKYLPNSDSLMTKAFKGTLSQFLSGKNFNPDYYTNYAIGVTNPIKVVLGKRLFFDPQLSKSGLISCGSCHQPEKYYTDGLTKANNFVHGGTLQRNTPTLYYAALQTNQFYDLRSTSLEDQANEVMKNTNEFNLSSDEVAKKIFLDTTYKAFFDSAFAGNPVGTRNYNFEVRNALAAFIRSLQPFSAPFDDYLKGSKTALTSDQILGFNLFTGKGKCATCHFVPLFNGNNPPWMSKSESEIIGVPAKPIWKNAVIDPDSGRFKINRLDALMFAFKTPTLRNVEKTAPYMHNGVYKTLEEVVDFYNRGGGVGIGIDIKGQSLPFDSLLLNENEKKAIVSFMKSLTDKQFEQYLK